MFPKSEVSFTGNFSCKKTKIWMRCVEHITLLLQQYIVQFIISNCGLQNSIITLWIKGNNSSGFLRFNDILSIKQPLFNNYHSVLLDPCAITLFIDKVSNYEMSFIAEENKKSILFSQDYNLACHTAYTVCVNFIYECRSVQFKVECEH